MYTVVIKKKEIQEQYDCILLTVELTCNKPIPEKKEKQYVLESDGKPKLDKHGKPKELKKQKTKHRTKTIYFKFPIAMTWEEMKAEIKKKVDCISKCEAEEIPIDTPIDFKK